jgi:hypothetical protein
MKTHALAFVAMALALSACGSKSEDDAGAGTQAATATANNSARAGDAVAAVLQSQGTPVARLAFVLETRPVVGQPFSIKLEVSAAEPVAALQLSAESTSLILAPASAILALASAGEPVTHELIATSQQEGLAELTVRLKAGEGAEAVYAVPVLVSAAGSAPAPAAGG